ncbi:MAG: hypothetical protein WC307_00435 [Candidatus Nanoarchaeia archaeon]|jgi:hypothetical protein
MSFYRYQLFVESEGLANELYGFDYDSMEMAVLGGYIREPEIFVEAQLPKQFSMSNIERIKAERQKLAEEKKRKQQKTFVASSIVSKRLGKEQSIAVELKPKFKQEPKDTVELVISDYKTLDLSFRATGTVLRAEPSADYNKFLDICRGFADENLYFLGFTKSNINELISRAHPNWPYPVPKTSFGVLHNQLISQLVSNEIEILSKYLIINNTNSLQAKINETWPERKLVYEQLQNKLPMTAYLPINLLG